jgi:hypothetical protein
MKRSKIFNEPRREIGAFSVGFCSRQQMLEDQRLEKSKVEVAVAMYVIHGSTTSLVDICKLVNVSFETIKNRLYRTTLEAVKRTAIKYGVLDFSLLAQDTDMPDDEEDFIAKKLVAFLLDDN